MILMEKPMINGLNKALAHLSHALRDKHDDDNAGGAATLSDLTPNWHGDHWQNLLSSPMDARRYILEDWSDTVDITDADDGAPRIDSFSGRLVRHYS
jgi:hypothetical protein